MSLTHPLHQVGPLCPWQVPTSQCWGQSPAYYQYPLVTGRVTRTGAMGLLGPHNFHDPSQPPHTAPWMAAQSLPEVCQSGNHGNGHVATTLLWSLALSSTRDFTPATPQMIQFLALSAC